MTDSYGGRVLAGEDSEEDDEDEEEMGFQLNDYASQSTRFDVPIVKTPSAGTEGESKEESDEEGEIIKSKELVRQEMDVYVEEEKHKVGEQGMTEKVNNMEFERTQVEASAEREHLLWEVDDSLDGLRIMSDAFVDTVRPSIDATIHRIAELKESQQRLLRILTEQNAGITSNEQLEDAAAVLDKLPIYTKKLQGIQLAMQEISTSSQKMKRRAENLRIDAQSYALKKENKRDEQTQWNKLYAAKSSKASD
ncbi:Snapin/Pallidin/Snn1 [Plasmopara halstedii]|uniref:Snapin/Pallidin/Snn1 n=1 Tax=Plasmopara halstedii TaxID=4781 RepID=A0A0P1AX46_PLAHL|nr:Snapin/Pallidin/Snn1 [Plasmopara halstedii]CEG46078.1 Snapin/Pallidin/Snn1 [Plasmopara halstedii]|eukprot:XP_024582447.1 Snapin/Pallidin/Snn1 [Plasmopara halstedii]